MQAGLDHSAMPLHAMKKSANAKYPQYGQVWKNMYRYYSLNHEIPFASFKVLERRNHFFDDKNQVR
jgi:hypothetical protein